MHQSFTIRRSLVQAISIGVVLLRLSQIGTCDGQRPSQSEISHFTNTPLDRFPRITIEIQAPVKDDPEQVILGRDSVWQTVSLIFDFIKERGQRSDHYNQFILPRIEIKLLDRSSATWFDRVAYDWQRFIPAYPEEDDIEFFLSPFRFVKGIGCAHIHLPDGLDDNLFFSLRELVTGMQLLDEFGTRLYATHCFESKLDYDDAMVLFDEEKFNTLQDACSFLHGETARIAELRSARKEFTEFDNQKFLRWRHGNLQQYTTNAIAPMNVVVRSATEARG